MGMPVVEVRPLFTVRQGLKASFFASSLVCPCALLIVVVLVATAIAVDSSSLSLLPECSRPCWVDVIVFLLLVGCGEGLSVLTSSTSDSCSVVGVFFVVSLLSGILLRVGFAVGLKKLVIGDVFVVLGPVCFGLYAGSLLGWLQMVVVGVVVVVGMFVSCWGDVMVDVAPTGGAT